MIELHRLNGTAFWLNSEKIKLLETNPDTCITLMNGEKFIVRNQVHEICQKIVDYKYMITHGFNASGTASHEK